MTPTHSPRNLTAYYKTTLGAFFLIGGLSLVIGSLWVTFQVGANLLLLAILGTLLFIFGCFCFRRPCFLLEPRQLTVYNLIGLKKKRYTFESWEFVKADSRRIYIDENGITIKVAVLPWLVKTEDWMAMRKML
ncbi:MAG: hypothetical protein AAF810_13010 [Cyanobacteria bacterium P01_D01_bin.36]